MKPAAIRFSTRDIPAAERGDWLREMICRNYANIDITSRVDEDFYSETQIFPLAGLQLSSIHSSAISIEKRPGDPDHGGQDAYFAVVLLSGRYHLQQDGREASLQPGDMLIYDAMRPHRIHCPDHFSKLIFAIPRPALKHRFRPADACTAVRMAGHAGMGAVASGFLRSWAAEIERLTADELRNLSQQSIDLLAWSLAAIAPTGSPVSLGQAATLTRVKAAIEPHLSNPLLNSEMIAAMVSLSPRYINSLFAREELSLMRYVLLRRLELCHGDIQHGRHGGLRITEIAFRRGFNDLSHFSRAFRQRFGVSPRELKSRFGR
ncbi:MAG: helix-turn-helix domain-containing protein [Methylococcales bacterium]|nr:helix-turn-helix domain-containing protein [Methylococcales bacterium]